MSGIHSKVRGYADRARLQWPMLRKVIAHKSRLLYSRLTGKRQAPLPSPEQHKKAANYLDRGRKYYNKKDYRNAEYYFRKAVQFDDRYGLAFYYLGLALYKRDNQQAAHDAWRKAVKAEPDSEAARKAQKKLTALAPQPDIQPD